MTEAETLPMSARLTPPRPRLPMTIRPTSSSSPSLTIASSDLPKARCTSSTLTPSASWVVPMRATVTSASFASATARSNSSLAIRRATLSCNMTIATSASPNPPMVDSLQEGVLGEGSPKACSDHGRPGNPTTLPPLTPVLYRASGLTGQAVALLLYLLYEHFVGVDELLHALRLQHLYYVVVVHAGLL